MSTFLKGRRARALPEPPPTLPTPVADRVRRHPQVVSPSLRMIAELWQARGGAAGTLPPLAGGSPLVPPSSATGGSSGSSQTGESPGYDFPRGQLQRYPGGFGTPFELPSLLDFGGKGDGKSDNTAAINATIASAYNEGLVGPSGLSWLAPPGVYLHEGEISALKGTSNIHGIGAGALVGGGAIGINPTKPIGTTTFLYTGAGPRAWDFRNSVGSDLVGCHTFANNAAFTGPIWDLSGTAEGTPSGFGHFAGSVAEATGAGGAALIAPCVGVNLDWSNEHHFDYCMFKGCKIGTAGLTNGAHFSVAHQFNNCTWAGSQEMHVSNPQEAWQFNTPVAESLFNNKGEISNSSRFISYTVAVSSHGVIVLNPWIGSNVPASRVGTAIEAKGDGWIVLGGSLNTSEGGVFFPNGPIASIVAGVRFWKVNAGVTITGNTEDSLIAFNRATEAIELLVDTIKTRKGSIIQTANNAALLVS